MVRLFIFIAGLFLFCGVSYGQDISPDIEKSRAEYDLANIAYAQNKPDQAYVHLQKAAIFDPSNSMILNSVGFMAFQKGELDKAIAYLELALPLDIERYGENHPAVASLWNNLAAILSKKGDHQKALQYFNKALTIIEGELGKLHPQVVSIRKSRDAEQNFLK